MQAFFETGHQFATLATPATKQVVFDITSIHLRPTSLRPPQPELTGHIRARSASIDLEFQPWPQNWATDKPLFRSDLKKFDSRTADLRTEQPSSTGNTPEYLATTIPPASSSTTDTSTNPTEPMSAEGSSSKEGQNHGQNQGQNSQGFTEAQRNELRTMLASMLPQPPADRTPPDDRDREVIVRESRFNPDDVGYFDPFYDNKSVDTAADIEHSGKATYFRDVHTFIERIKDVVRTKGSEVVSRNLQLCLRGSALTWYTRELTEDSKRLLGYNPDEWYRLLHSRWKAPRSVSLSALLHEKYTLQDAAKRREPREYAQAMVKAAQNAEMGTTKDHILMVWQNLDMEFQRDIPEPGQEIDYNAFLESIDRRKHQWWHYASRYAKLGAQQQPRRGDRFDGRNDRNQRGGYSREQQFRSQFQAGGSRQQPYRNDYPYYGN